MSGIIGGAGSKSGIIGETEIDYETGTWTPSHDNPHGSNTGSYVKIGKKVFAEGWLMASGGSSGTGNAIGGGCTHYQNNVGGTIYGIHCFGSTSFSFYSNGTDTAFADGKQTHFSLSYTTT